MRALSRRLSRPTQRFTRELIIDPIRTEMFYEMYNRAFGPLRTRCAARQVLNRDEFTAVMGDARVEKFLAWDGRAHPVGITTLTNDLSTVPWISPEYFAARFPEHWARNAIYYLGFTLADPEAGNVRLLEAVVHEIVHARREEHALIAYDVCAYNDEVLKFSPRIDQVLAQYAGTSRIGLDSQTYYVVAL